MTISTLLFIIFTGVVGIQIIYYLSFLFLFALKQPKKGKDKFIPLSVIICAKNEAENLKNNLPFILNQNHQNFEIVLVNDSSSDNTLEVMEEFKKKYFNINIVDVKPIDAFWGNKKYALTLGIKATKNDFLVFTDADCKPLSNKWLMHLSSKFTNQKSIVLGYGAYEKKRFSVLNKLIRFETVITALQYFSYANLGLPYMGVGRNLAYRKELFFNNSGFNSHMNLNSGDDDLFVNEVANSENTALCFSVKSFTISKPKSTFKSWILQKRRHISTAKYYKPLQKFLLGIFYMSQLLFWILSIALLIYCNYLLWIWILITIRFAIHWLSFGLSAKNLKEKDLILFAPLLDLFLVCTQLIIFSANLISKPKHWK